MTNDEFVKPLIPGQVVFDVDVRYTCPVCGFPGLGEPPADFYTCPCCATIFGSNEGEDPPAKEMRRCWINGGMRWASEKWPAPPGWDPVEQLRNLEEACPRSDD